MENRENHPLWNDFIEWSAEHRCNCGPSLNANWPVWLGGGEAMAEYLPKKVAAAHVTPRCKVLADRLTDAVTRLEILSHRQESQIGDQVGDQARLLNVLLRLEELAKKPTPMELSHVANRFNAGIKQLEELAERHERMGLMVTVMESANVTMGSEPTG